MFETKPPGRVAAERVDMRKFLITVAMASTASGVFAASFDDPDWPCIQRKVPTLSTGQMWAGPEITAEIIALGKDPNIAALASRLALRRIAVEDAETMIAEFAEGLEEDRNQKLTALFAHTFDLISAERTTIISGISRYAHKQSGLSDQIETRRGELTKLEAAEPPDYDRIEELQDFLEWDERIFRERSQSLTYVCETPVILEKRIFALARAIQAHLAP